MVTARRACDESKHPGKQNKKQTSQLNATLKYAAEGFRIVPCHSVRHGKCTCRLKVCTKPGKHPRIKDWPQGASCDAAQIAKWFAKWPDANFGVATGAGSGIIALDFDGDQGRQTLDQMTTDDPSILETRVHQTGNIGAHLFYQYPGFPVANSVRLLPGMDVRGDNGLIILPPSVHLSGRRYAVTSELPIATLPPAILEKIHDHCRCHKESSGGLKRFEEKQSKLKQGEKKEEVHFQTIPTVPPERIEWALKESLPHGPGRRNKQVFQLARHLQAIEGITQKISANAFRRVVERWHNMLFEVAARRGFNVAGDFEETWADFRYAWTRVRHPVGQTLQPVFDSAVQMDSDGEVSPLVWNSLEYFRRTENRSMRLLVTVLYELALRAGDDPFSLACDAGAFQFRRVGVDEASGKWLHRRLLAVTDDQVIACVDRGKSAKQTERKPAKYVWTWTIREPPTNEF